MHVRTSRTTDTPHAGDGGDMDNNNNNADTATVTADTKAPRKRRTLG